MYTSITEIGKRILYYQKPYEKDFVTFPNNVGNWLIKTAEMLRFSASKRQNDEWKHINEW